MSMSMQRCDALGTCAKHCGDCYVRSANASFAPGAAKAAKIPVALDRIGFQTAMRMTADVALGRRSGGWGISLGFT